MAAPAPPPAYSFFGHSCSTGEEFAVPPGCMLVTLAECGDYTFAVYGNPFNRFTSIFQDPAYQALLADPITNQLHIEYLLGTRININHPNSINPANRRYMDTLFSAELHHLYNVGAIIAGAPVQYPTDPNQKYDIYRSGLYRAGSINLQPQLKNVIEIITNLNADINFMYPPEVLFPNRDDVIVETTRLQANGTPAIQLFDSIGRRFQIKQSRLFEMFPGVHYLVTCRSPCTADSLTMFRTRLRRSTSRNANAILNYAHIPSTDPMNIIGKVHQGQIGQFYRLPRGVHHTNYIYYSGRRPHYLLTTGNDQEIIQILSRGGGSRRRVKRRSKGTRTYKHRK